MISFVLILITALFFPGIIIRAKSIFAGRKGAGVLQPWKNVYVQFNKGSVYSKTTSYIFKMSPVVLLSGILSASLLVPVIRFGAVLNFGYSFIVFAYLLALGRFFMIIAALDTGSGFEGMGAAREGLYSIIIEPAFFILIASLSLLYNGSTFADIVNIASTNELYLLIGFIAAYILGVITVVETCRVPLDDPKTHLELTMIHEVMILDYSGFELALINVATYFKFAIFGSLIATCLVPQSLPILLQILFYFIVQFGFAVSIGFLESFTARLRLRRNPQFVLTASAIALFLFVFTLMISL